MHVLIGPLVETDRVSGLESPGHAVPLAVDVATVIGGVVELLDLDVDVQVLLEVLLHELHLRAHLRKVLIVEQRRLEALGLSRLGHELLGLVRAVLPPGTELLQGRRLVLVVDIRYAPARNPVALEDRVHLLLAVDGHRDRASHPHVVVGRLVLGEGQPPGRESVVERLHEHVRIGLASGLHLGRARQPDEVALAGPERRQARCGVRRGEDDVLVDVRAALIEVVGIALEHHAHLAGVLLHDVRPGPDQALLEVAVLFQNFLREDEGDWLGDIVGEEGVRRLEVHPDGVLVGCLRRLNFLEGERLHALFRVLLRSST